MTTEKNYTLDSLTGLCNRWFGEQQVNKQLSERKSGYFGVLDVSHFRTINENFGHECGDLVLIAITDLLKKFLNPEQAIIPVVDDPLIMHVGADEFAFNFRLDIPAYKFPSGVQKLFGMLNQLKVPGHDDYRIDFNLGLYSYDGSKELTYDEVYTQAHSMCLKSKDFEGNYLFTQMGGIPDVGQAFLLLREDRILYNETNNQLFNINDENSWLAYLNSTAQLKGNMCIRNTRLFEQIIQYYKRGQIVDGEFSFLYKLVYQYLDVLDPFMLETLVGEILLPHYEPHFAQGIATPNECSKLAMLYLLMGDTSLSIYRMGDKDMADLIVPYFQKCIGVSRDIPETEEAWDFHIYAICGLIGQPDLLTGISRAERWDYYNQLCSELGDRDVQPLHNKFLMGHFGHLLNGATNYPLLFANHLLLKSSTTPEEQRILAQLMDFLRENTQNWERFKINPGEFPRIDRVIRALLFDNNDPSAVAKMCIKELREIRSTRHNGISSADFATVAMLFSMGNIMLQRSTLMPVERRKQLLESWDIFLLLFKRRNNTADDQQVYYLAYTLLKELLASEIINGFDKVGYVIKSMGILMLDTYSHSMAVSAYARVITANIIDRKPELLIGVIPSYTSIEIIKARRESLLHFIHYACMLHDIGKIRIPGIIANTYRQLSDHERKLICSHPELGFDFLKGMPEFVQFEAVVLGHHKWYNGKQGYPAGFKNNERHEHLIVDIISMCDSLEAATSHIGRMYKAPKPFCVILDEFFNESGTRYNPEVLQSIISSPETYMRLKHMVDHDWQNIYRGIYEEIVTERELDPQRVDVSNRQQDLMQLDNEQIRLLLKVYLDRNDLLVRKNNLYLFRYTISSDTMNFSFSDSEGNVMHMETANYHKTAPQWLFSVEVHKRVVEIIDDVLKDPEKNVSGSFEFEYIDRRHAICSFTLVKGFDGTPYAVVGQLQEVIMTREHMLRTIEQQNEYMSVVNTLKNAYETMLYIDLSDGSYKLLQGTEAVAELCSKVKKINEVAELFCKYQVCPEDHDIFMQLVDVDTLSERLNGQKFIMAEYGTLNIGWCHARVIPADFDSKGRVTHAIFTTECAEEQHRKQVFLKYAAETDGLTHLLNRKTGEARINELLQNQQPGLFAMFDCDRFKSINDTMSHLMGDHVLVAVSRAIREIFKDQSLVRLGGDEFVVFISGDEITEKIHNGQDLREIFEPLKKRIAAISLPGFEGFSLSVSGGVAIYDGSRPVSFEDLYLIADKALHVSKHGRHGHITYVKVE